jgi:hypothetical protein
MALDKEDDEYTPMGEEDIMPFLQYVEAHGATDLDLSSDLAVEIQAKYIANVGSHPFEALKSISQNPLCKAADRIAASKALLEYSHRKIPQKVDVTNTSAFRLDPAVLAGLSVDELALMETLLAKLSTEPV